MLLSAPLPVPRFTNAPNLAVDWPVRKRRQPSEQAAHSRGLSAQPPAGWVP
jgi:hypothetical protein